MTTPATCHPERALVARGLCRVCYSRERYHGRLNQFPSKKGNVERFWASVDFSGDCWVWTGRLEHGYGRPRFNGRKVNAHRLAWELLVGLVPSDKVPDHLCRNRACVNPDHLELVSAVINTIRGHGPGAVNSRKTHCSKGHPYDYIEPSTGKRRCRTCYFAVQAEYRKRRASNAV